MSGAEQSSLDIGPMSPDGTTRRRFLPTPNATDGSITAPTPERWEERRRDLKAKNPNLGDLHLRLGTAVQMMDGESISSAEVSPASPSPSPASAEDRTTNDGSGPSSLGSFAYYDLATSSWRTFQVSLLEEWGDVLGDLAESGYDCEWDCIPAAAVGAPHLRYRVFIVAHANSPELRLQPAGLAGSGNAPLVANDGGAKSLADSERAERRTQAEGRNDSDGTDARREEASGRARASGRTRREGFVAHADGRGREGEWVSGLSEDTQPSRRDDTDGRRGAIPDDDGAGRADAQGRAGSAARWWPIFGPSPARLRSDQWLAEPDVGRVAHGVPSRVDRLRGLGNAVVPQVAEWIGRRLMEMDGVTGDQAAML